MKPLLEVRDLSLSYHTPSGETPALSHISFNLMPGEFLAIVGPSGCGKSTLLNVICGLLKPEKGSVLMNGTQVSRGDPRIGYMLQKDHLLEWRTIYKNILLGLEIRHQLSPEKLSSIEQMLRTYGLDKFRSARPSQLSGGMRQRAALIRTLALKPELLLLDEPFSALDYQTRLNVSDDIGRILKKENKPAILVTHDISEAISMADRVLILTKRPATIAGIIPIELSVKNRTPLSSRNAPDFKSYFNQIWKELNDQSLFVHIGITLAETLTSFFFVVLLGIGTAVLLWLSPKLSRILEPYLVILNSLPKSALAPLLIVWLGANVRTIIVAGMSVAIFGSIINLYAGFRETDPDKSKLIATLGGTRKDELLKIVLPSSVPLILSIMKVNIGLCLVGVIIGEFIGARQGLGYLIIYSSQTFKLTTVLMSILILCVIAMGLYGVLSLIEKYCLKHS